MYVLPPSHGLTSTDVGTFLLSGLLLVSVSRLDILFKGFRLGLQCLDSGILPCEGGLHGLKHAHLHLLEVSDARLGLALLLYVVLGLHDVVVGGRSIVIRLVLSHFAHHLLARVVGILRVLGFILLLSQLLPKEVVIVRFEEPVEVFTTFDAGVKDLFLVAGDAGHVLVTLVFVLGVLALDPQSLTVVGSILVVDVLLFPVEDGVSEVRVLVRNPDLFLKAVLLDSELADAILDQQLLHLPLLKEQLLLELGGALHVSDVLLVFG